MSQAANFTTSVAPILYSQQANNDDAFEHSFNGKSESQTSSKNRENIETKVTLVQPSGSSSTLFTEGFEGSFPSTNWWVGDSDPTNGDDYWDDVSRRAYSGYWSGWCAAVGTKTDGTPNTNTWTYDNYMQAYLSRWSGAPFDARNWDIAFLTYRAWYDTEPSYDHLDLAVTGDGSNWRGIFQYRDNSLSDSNGDWKLSGNSGGWQYRIGRVPETTSAGAVYTSSFNIGFNFQSDYSIGPGQYEGAYLDDLSFSIYHIDCDYVSVSSTNVNPGDTIQLGYKIDNVSPFTLRIWLGATLTSPSGSQINDPAHDVIVLVPGYSHQYWYRDFAIPTSAQPGLYDITYALWSGWTSPIDQSRQWWTWTWNDILNVQSFDFSISASPSSRTVTRGSSTTYSVTVTLLSGLTQLVSLSVSGLPSGASSSFNPASGYPSFVSTLTISTSVSTPADTYTLTITGSEGGTTRQTTVQLVVEVGTITVSGRFVFLEEDGTTERNVRYARVQLCDSDLGGALISVLAETETQTDGSYLFPPRVNDDGWLEDGYDIFVRVYTDSFAVVVTSNSWPNYPIYEDQTPQLDNVADGPINMGKRVISSNTGAWAIYDTIILGWQYATTLAHFHSKVTARWPISGSSSTDNDVLINIRDTAAFREDVILHEYGHAIQYNVYGEWIPESGGPHSWDVPTNPNFAFSEGWATFFGVSTANEIGYGDSLFPKDSWYRNFVNHNLETDTAGMGDDVEGAIACLLWDIYDSSNDGRDSLSAGMSPIWDVFKNYITSGHNPYTIHEFWDGWMNRGHNSDQQMWGIYYDHGINKDTNAPSNPTSFTSSHQVRVWSNDNTIEVTWTGATDDLSGVLGYSFTWDSSPSTLPPEWDTPYTGTLNISQPLSSGTSWYLHVRTVDRAGIWVDTAYHIGPFYIDVDLPSTSVYHSPTDPTDADSVQFHISASDGHSGLSFVGIYWYDGVWHEYTWSLSGETGLSDSIDVGRFGPGLVNYYALVYDVAGNEMRDPSRKYKSFTVVDDDTTPPSLYDPVSSGDVYDSYTGDYLLQISTSDSSGIYSVHFAYRFGSGPWSGWKSYAGNSGDAYWYYISRSEWITHVGETIYWEVYVWDNDVDRPDDALGIGSSTYTGGVVYDDDTAGPVFSNSMASFIKVPRIFRVQIDVTDPSDVYTVRFSYRLAGGSWSDWYDYTGSEANTYWFDIEWNIWSPFADDVIDWLVYAEDLDDDGWAGDRTGSQSSQYSDFLPPFNVVLYVPTDCLTIQTAIDAAYNGDTIYVYAGTYNENLCVTKSLSLIGEDRSTTIIDGNQIGDVVEITANYVNFTGFTIQNSGTYPYLYFGIYVYYSSNNNISNNIIKNNYLGVNLFVSQNNIISGNKITDNGYGIMLADVAGSIIHGNEIVDNGCGIKTWGDW